MLRARLQHRVAPAAASSSNAADRAATRTPAQLDESRAHHRLFLDLSGNYEEHCRRSGRSESPALCAAADRFRRERSLASLIAFADCLDELDIPAPAVHRRR